MDKKEKKQVLRKEIQQKMKQLTEDYQKATDAAIADKIIHLPEFIEAETVFCFVSTKEEINTFPILEQVLRMGKTLVVPKCGKPGIMDVYQIQDFEDLQPGFYGILEPKSECRLVLPAEIDFSITPCLSCDEKGGRLGKGGGYYDRYLEQRTYPAAAICRQILLSECIPMEKWDQTMDLVITEEHVFRMFGKDED